MIQKILFTLILFCLISCSSSKTGEPGSPNELIEKKKSDSGFSVDTPEGELLSEGKRLYESGLYSVAKDAFESLKEGYPNSSSAEFAAIKIADCLFETSEYTQARQRYEEFVREKPSSSEAPYALFRAGRAMEESFTGIGRDPTPLKEAKALFERVIKEYPISPYARESERKLEEDIQKLNEYENEVVEFYYKADHDKAAEARERSINTAPKKEASLVVPSVIRLKRKDESVEPSSDLQPNEQEKKEAITINRIFCDSENKRFLFYIDKDLRTPLETVRSPGKVSLRADAPFAGFMSERCFGVTAHLNTQGELILVGGSVVSMLLENPARILVQIK